MSERNGFLTEIIAKAEANGWMVLVADLNEWGCVTLMDPRGNKVTIETAHGLLTPAYVERFKAIPLGPEVDR